MIIYVFLNCRSCWTGWHRIWKG